MALFEKLKDTKLKSLKFGEKGTAGDSTKPYIVTDINKVDTPFNRLRLTKFDDGLVRGGVVGAINSSVVDTLRIGKFLIDFPKGPLFIAKQVGLQLANPPLETKQLPTNRVGNGIIGQAIAGASNVINKLNNLVGGPTRIYNLGINTLAQVPLNAFGGHIARHGFLPRLDNSQKYESVVTANNTVVNEQYKTISNNRLVKLYSDFFQSNSSGTTFRANVFNKTISDNFGGASSVYGIGRTTIRRTTFTGREFDITPAAIKEVPKTIQQGILEHVYDPNTIYQKYKLKFDQTASIDDFKYKPQLTTSKKDIDLALEKVNNKVPNYEPVKRDNSLLFFDSINQSDVTDLKEANFLGEIPSYFISQVSASYNISSSGVTKALGADIFGFQKEEAKKAINNYLPKTTNKKYNELTSAKVKIQKNFLVPSNFDKSTFEYDITLLKRSDISIDRTGGNDANHPFKYFENYNGTFGRRFQNYERNDADNFSISFTQLNPFTGTKSDPLVFTGYINGYSETYDSSWDSTKYNGRSDFLYTFTSYKKTASFKLKLPAFNWEELDGIHLQLQLLQEGLAGAYYNNRLGGIITYVDLGYYLGNVPCIITSMNISIPDEASWDLNTKQSMLLEATFNLIVIGEETPELVIKVNPPTPKPTPTLTAIIPKPIPIEIEKPKIIPVAPPIKSDATVTKFTSESPGSGTYKGVNAKQQSEALKKKIKLKPRTKQQEKDLAKKLGSK
jgi:hypothetical protein